MTVTAAGASEAFCFCFETLVTSCFLHGSILHLGFNLLVLWQVGPFLERAVGRARFLPLYLGAGISFLIGMQAFINIGVVTSALPNNRERIAVSGSTPSTRPSHSATR